MGRIGASCKIGYKKESSYGTYATPDIYYRALTESFLPKYDFVQDDTLIGNELPPTQWVAGENAEGALDGPLFPDQTGRPFLSVLGGEAAVSDPAIAYLLVSYNGTETYSRLSLVGTDLIAEKSSNGSAWSADTSFCTTGTMDLTAAAYDTLTEVQVAIAGYTGWDCILLGAGTTASSTLVAFAVTNLMAADVQQGAILIKAAATSSTTAKTHSITPAALGTDLPSFSFIVDRGLGTNKSLTFMGQTGKSFAINLTAKDVTKATWTLTGKNESVDQNDVSITVPTIEPFKAAYSKVIFQDSTGALTEFTEIKNIGLTIDPAIDDNRVVGDLYPKQPERQQSKYEVTCSANATTTQYAYISQFKANSILSMYIYCKSVAYVDSTYVVPYSFFIRIPNFMFSDFSSPTSGKDKYVINMPGKAYKSSSAVYTSNIYVSVVDGTVATY